MSPISNFLEDRARAELSTIHATGLELEVARLRAKQAYLIVALKLIIVGNKLDLVQSLAFETLEDIKAYDKEIATQ